MISVYLGVQLSAELASEAMHYCSNIRTKQWPRERSWLEKDGP